MNAESRRNSDGVTCHSMSAKIITISLHKADSSYNAGDTISGEVVLHLPKPIRLKGILVQVYGQTKVTWHEETSYFKGFSVKTERNNEDLFLDDTIKLDVDKKHTTLTESRDAPRCSLTEQFLATPSTTPLTGRRMSLWDCAINNTTSSFSPAGGTGKDQEHVIQAGVHKYSFNLYLPFRLPSSYKGRWGSIQYGIKARLDRNGKSLIENETDFTVTDVINLNDSPELGRPIAGSETFEPSGWCCAMGNIDVSVRVARKGYSRGDVIPFHVELTNNSKLKARDPRVALIQHVSFRSANSVRRLTNTLVTVSKRSISPGDTCIWDKDKLVVPHDALPTCVELKAIQIKYTLSVLLGNSFSIPINIIIATESFKRDTLLKFYSRIGLAVAQGAGGSPSLSLRSSRLSIMPACDRSPIVRLRREQHGGDGSRKSSIASLVTDNRPVIQLSGAGMMQASCTRGRAPMGAVGAGDRCGSISETTPLVNTSRSPAHASSREQDATILPAITIVDHT